MSSTLCISFRFIQPYPLFHGRSEDDEPEWPPSPMRAFQSLLNAASLRTRGKPLPPEVRSALQVIEGLRPSIVAPQATACSVGHRVYVPHNQADLVMAAWERGHDEASIALHRIEKDFRAHKLETTGDDLPAVHYLYALESTSIEPNTLLAAIRPSVRSIHCLGWGIDQVVADARLLEPSLRQLTGESWSPTPGAGKPLRVPQHGSLEALAARHESFLTRLDQGNWTPVPPLRAMDRVPYRRATDPLPRPYATFRLLDANDDTYRHPARKAIHIAAMVRHLAIEAMQRRPPPSVKDPMPWINRYVAGHRDPVDQAVGQPHSQLSYVPLPSIGHHHADASIRRVMLVAPLGDEAILEHICQYLDGLRLEPEEDSDLRAPVFLHRAHHDNVESFYTRSNIDHRGCNRWASVTPVILPGYDDRDPRKTRKLIEKALVQSGITQPCEFEWGAFSYFSQALPAYAANFHQSPKGHIRPRYLINQPAVHLTLKFEQDARVPGPMLLGSGKHCGFGVMAGIA